MPPYDLKLNTSDYIYLAMIGLIFVFTVIYIYTTHIDDPTRKLLRKQRRKKAQKDARSQLYVLAIAKDTEPASDTEGMVPKIVTSKTVGEVVSEKEVVISI